MKRIARCLGLSVVLAAMTAAPAWSSSLSVAGPNPPSPHDLDGPTLVTPPQPSDPTSGSAALVPVMATDTQAGQSSGLDAAATAGNLDDFSFVIVASERARRGAHAARAALPQLKNPDLKRIAENLLNDHDHANAKLASVALARNWPVTSASHSRPTPSRVEPALTAFDAHFDSKWTADMIAANEESKALYGAQAQGDEDTDLRRLAREILPTIEHHLVELRRLQK
jgi:putative membrane protein